MNLSDTNILVVEDEWITARDIQETLRGLGYHVPLAVSTAEEALEEAERNPPGLVLMDIRLRGEMDGIEAAERLRERFRTPVVYLSAHTDEPTLERAKRTEPYGYLVKPFSEEELRSTIQTALYKASTERALWESEQRYRTLFERSPLPMCLFDINLRILDVNAAAVRHYGYTREEFRSLTLLDIGPLEDIPDFMTRFDNVFRDPSDDPHGRVFRHRKKDGSIIHVEVSAVECVVDGQELRIATINDVTRSIQAEQALRESESRFRQLAENMREAFWMFTPDFSRTLYVGPAYERIWGESRENLMRNSRYCLEPTLPEDRPGLAAVMDRLQEGEQRVQFRIRRPDGAVRWLEARGFPIRDEAGHVRSVAGLTEDITERRRAEEAVRQSEERFRLMVASVSDYAIILLDPQGRVVHWNAGAERVHGYTAAEVQGRSLELFFPPEDRAEGRPGRLLQTAARLERDEDEGWRVRGDGTRFWASVLINAVRNSEGGLVGYAMVTRDLTERHRIEEENRRKADMVRLLQETAVAANEAESTDAVFRVALEQICAHTGWSIAQVLLPDGPEGVLRPAAVSYVARPELEPHLAGLRTDVEFGAGVGIPGRVAATGQPLWISDVATDPRFVRSHAAQAAGLRSVIAFPVLAGHEPVAVMEFFSEQALAPDPLLLSTIGNIGTQLGRVVERERAATDILRAKEEAERANLAKSEFLGRMSHELRTPLNAILGFGQLLQVDLHDPDDQESVEQILAAGRHLLKLIDEVLDIAKIEAGHLGISVEPVHLDSLVSQAVDLMRPLAAQRRLGIAWAPGRSDRYVQADAQRLKQVLLNLLSNAIKYNHEGGAVEVAVSGRAGAVQRIEVRDTGPGLSPADQARLFMPFQRLSAEHTDVQGTGLGLALSKGLVEAMGGRIGVESTVGRGSTFWVELPPAGAEGEKPAATAPGEGDAHPVERRYSVLYVEDNPRNVRLVERILARRPEVELMIAMDAALGLELAREYRPDLILLDLNLPDVHGEEVLRRIQADPALNGVPVVVVSADNAERQKERLLAQGARAYLTKPIDVQEFLDVLQRQLEAGGSWEA